MLSSYAEAQVLRLVGKIVSTNKFISLLSLLLYINKPKIHKAFISLQDS